MKYFQGSACFAICLQLFLILNFIVISDSACGVCNATSNFVCLSSTQFIKCNTSAMDYSNVWNCPYPTVCIESLPLATPLISIPCFQNTTGSNITFTASCDRPSQTIIVNTTSTTFNAATWCASRSAGLYPVPNSAACTNYVRCFKKNNAVSGAVFQCPGTSRFDSVALFCDVNTTC